MNTIDSYNLKVWLVLRKIEEAYRFSKDGKSFEYWIFSPTDFSFEGAPSPSEEGKIIDQLEYQKVIEKKEPNPLLDKGEVVVSKTMNRIITIYNLQMLPKFQGVYKKHEKLIKHLPQKELRGATLVQEVQRERNTRETFSCAYLHVDFTGCTMRYGDNPVIEMSPDTQELKLLKLLLMNPHTVQYWEIAKELNLPIYKEGNRDNKKYARDVNFVRRNLVDVLKKAGMEESAIKQMILAKKNVGYVLRCLSLIPSGHKKIT